MIIDTHAHTVPKSLLDALNSERRLFPSVRLHGDGPMPRMEFAGQGPGRPIQPRLHDLAQRRGDSGAEIDLTGINGDVADLVDSKEGIDFGERDRLGAGLRHRFRQRAGG